GRRHLGRSRSRLRHRPRPPGPRYLAGPRGHGPLAASRSLAPRAARYVDRTRRAPRATLAVSLVPRARAPLVVAGLGADLRRARRLARGRGRSRGGPARTTRNPGRKDLRLELPLAPPRP